MSMVGKRVFKAGACFALMIVFIMGLLAMAGCGGGGGSDDPAPQTKTKYTILMIGSGMGFNQALASGYYQGDSGFPSVYDPLDPDDPDDWYDPLGMSTYSADGGVDGYDADRDSTEFNYATTSDGDIKAATDSEAATTAMATEIKTNNGYIGVTTTLASITNILEVAKGTYGKDTGIVTSVPLSDPAVAAFAAKDTRTTGSNSDGSMTPSELFDSILDFLYIDLIMATGHPKYDEDGTGPGAIVDTYIDAIDGTDNSTWTRLENTADGLNPDQRIGFDRDDSDGDNTDYYWRLLELKSDITALADYEAGVNSGSTTYDWPIRSDETVPRMPRYICIPQVHDSLQYHSSSGSLPATVPSLKEMTESALNVLSMDPDGFILVVVGGAIRNACEDGIQDRMLDEIKAFEDAVQAVVDWVEATDKPSILNVTDLMTWENTVLIVAGNHETGYLQGPASGPPDTWDAIVDNNAGFIPGMDFFSNPPSGPHTETNSLVPLWVRGEGADVLEAYADQPASRRDYPNGLQYMDNTDLADFLFHAVQYIDLGTE